jgi:Putative transposase
MRSSLRDEATLVQRFGGSLNLNVHFHVVFLDGVFTRDEQCRVRFHALLPPDRDDLDALVRRIHKRAVAWLRRRRYAEARREEEPDQDSEPGALEACAAIAMQRGSFAKLKEDAALVTAADAATEPERLRFVAEHEGWNLHAGVRMAAGDDLGRERLLRYGARPPLALDRLRRLPDGRISYRIKYARTRSKHRVMTPLELMARLSALIPPPRYPLVRFHGVLGPRSAWRKDVVPKPRNRSGCEPEDLDSRSPARRNKGVREPRSAARPITSGSQPTERPWEPSRLAMMKVHAAACVGTRVNPVVVKNLPAR